MKRAFHAAAILCLGIYLTGTAMAAESGGGVIVRIPDGVTTRCVNASRDTVWLTLRRVIVDKTKGWLTKDSSAAIIINASVTTRPKPLSFPLATQADLGDYSVGQVSIPVEYTIVDGLQLTQGKVKMTGLQVELTLLNMRSKTGLGVALQALVDVTKKLPIPENPATQAATYLLDYANTSVSNAVKAQGDADKLKSAAIAMNFSPNGKCEGPGFEGFETTGTKIVLQESGVPGPGYVDVGKTNEYCWRAETTPAFVVSAARPQRGSRCGDAVNRDKFVPVSNNYVGFFLNAVGSSGVLGGIDEADKEAALNRCKQHGIKSAQSCL